MTPEISRRVARAMGKARPGPTPTQRRQVQRALEDADRWEDVPVDMRRLVARWEASAIGGR